MNNNNNNNSNNNDDANDSSCGGIGADDDMGKEKENQYSDKDEQGWFSDLF